MLLSENCRTNSIAPVGPRGSKILRLLPLGNWKPWLWLLAEIRSHETLRKTASSPVSRYSCSAAQNVSSPSPFKTKFTKKKWRSQVNNEYFRTKERKTSVSRSFLAYIASSTPVWGFNLRVSREQKKFNLRLLCFRRDFRSSTVPFILLTSTVHATPSLWRHRLRSDVTVYVMTSPSSWWRHSSVSSRSFKHIINYCACVKVDGKKSEIHSEMARFGSISVRFPDSIALFARTAERESERGSCPNRWSIVLLKIKWKNWRKLNANLHGAQLAILSRQFCIAS